MIVIRSSPANSDPLEFFLSVRGHWSEHATSAKEGLALIDATGDKIIWIDMELHDMNAYELACRIRASPGCEGCTLIALVGAAADEDWRSLRAAGFAHWIHKPIDLEQVQAVLQLIAPEQHRS